MMGFSLLIAAVSIYLFFGRKLPSRALIFWVLLAAALITYSANPSVLYAVQSLLGTELISTTTIMIAVMFLIIMNFILYLRLSSYDIMIRKLAQRTALLEADMNNFSARRRSKRAG